MILNKFEKDLFIQTKEFDKYIEQTKKKISKYQHYKLNSPFELKPKSFNRKKGVLLVHGLFDSPYGVRYLAEYFKNKGFLVRAVLLPGHGTVPSDLLDITYKDFIETVDFGIKSFSKIVENLYLTGISIGAALCINLYMKNNRNIKGLFLFSPAIKFKKIVYLSKFLNFFNIKWINKSIDLDPVRYESRTLNSVIQAINLLKENEKLLHKNLKISVPIFAVLTEDDELLDIQKTISFLNNKKEKKLSIFLYGDNEINQSNNVKFINKLYPEFNIISLSHSCLAMSPYDSIYGINGMYKSCYHYNNDKIKLNKCKNSSKILLGATSKKNIKKYSLIRKLTFNPDFYNMLKLLDTFIESEC